MAMNIGNRNSNNARGNSNNGPQAKGFLNFYLPTTSGGRKKLGYLPLREGYRTEEQVLAKLQEDPQMVARLIELLEVEFNPYDPDSEDNELAL